VDAATESIARTMPGAQRAALIRIDQERDLGQVPGAGCGLRYTRRSEDLGQALSNSPGDGGGRGGAGSRLNPVASDDLVFGDVVRATTTAGLRMWRIAS
jgi:hypothetical protein